MNMKSLIHHMNPPCSRCPYKLGLVQTLINPCPQCRENGYQTFERFQKNHMPATKRADEEMDSVNSNYILRVLETENRWLTFDELYHKAQSGCDWTDFALQLEYLVKQGTVEYKQPCGMDVGCYRSKKRNSYGY